ncbi:hypothetical protein LTR56_017494 [Elasticomyces elasticus]|nr:hypothetical protein LTR56_017494 [Elasticomyces elasticus]KAK3640903.1 hypothetical protein LTR22_016828 [Elasticomyces elasticus]KAK4920294.1 hypothetical protein LTR49_012073 [Elasticomyces elasticus]KAK5759093.1 hypothetical protein LTS12_010868 [Elasticomyces elasticus]
MAADSPNSAINALGTVLGYIGAEAATSATFARLLWPQRAYSHLGFIRSTQLALLKPAGGSLYKAVLEALDSVHQHGLFRGQKQGHMLGSPFFPDSRCEYTSHSGSKSLPSYCEASRNNLWVRVIALMPFQQSIAHSKEGRDAEKASGQTQCPVRAQVVVRYVKLRVVKVAKGSGRAPMTVHHDCKAWSLDVLIGTTMTELSGIMAAAMVAFIWKSWFAILWVVPLALKLLSAGVSLQREPLDLTATDLLQEKAQDFEVHLPATSGTFLLISGPPSLVLQFFRHYGHPKRDSTRETIQLVVIITLGLFFPFSLLCSVAWMPTSVQYVWLVYQMYVVGAMYISRYLGVGTLISTEAGIASMLVRSEGFTSLWEDGEHGLVVEGALESNFLTRYGEGQAYVRSLLKHR